MRRKDYDHFNDTHTKFALAASPPISKDAKASRVDWFTTKDGKIAGELNNIAKGVCPYETGSDGTIGVRDAIVLCQKAYWNVSIFRSTIDIQTEFSNSSIHFRSTNKRVAKFYTHWYEKIGGWALGERFFREWFRSGNLFIFRFNGPLNPSEYRKFTRAAEGVPEIPLRYIILNPADIRLLGNSSFLNAEYAKVLNSYELARLKNPTTDDEKEFMASLDPKIQAKIRKGEQPLIPLKQEDMRAVFCGKQDYEAMAVPMYYSVLPDIDLKLEFKKAEKVLARTIDYAVLLITAGETDNKNNFQILQDITELFSAESVGRVVVADHTAEGKWLVPPLNEVFGAEKFQVVNEDIANGLFNIFYSSEKFANTLVKTKIFLERLNQAREAYLNYFLLPEMKDIAKKLGFTDIPLVEFEDIDLSSDIEMKKLYVHMAEIGALTTEETITAIETGVLPLPEDSIQSQQDFKKLKDKGLYESLINPPKEEGRPVGTKAPKRTKVGPIGASVEKKFSMSKISENLKDFYAFTERVEEAYKTRNNIIRLSKKNKQLCRFTAESISMRETKENWDAVIPKYLDNPNAEGNPEYYSKVLSIAAEHNVNDMLSVVLANSIIKEDE